MVLSSMVMDLVEQLDTVQDDRLCRLWISE